MNVVHTLSSNLESRYPLSNPLIYFLCIACLLWTFPINGINMWCFEIWLFYPMAVSGSESSFCDLYQIWCSSFGAAARPTQKLRSPSSHTPNTHGEKQKGSIQEKNGRHRPATRSKQQSGSSARWCCRDLSLLAENAPWLGHSLLASGSWSIVRYPPWLNRHILARSGPDPPQGMCWVCVSLCFFPIPVQPLIA